MRAVSLFLLIGFFIALLPRQSSAAQEFVLNILTNESTARVTIDAFSQTDTDTTRLGGTVTLALDSVAGPKLAGLGDFKMRSLQALNFRLDLGLLFGRVTADIPTIRIERHATPPLIPLLPIRNGSIVVSDVEYRTFGRASYKVTGLACSALMAQDVPCSDNIVLDNAPPNTIEEATLEITTTASKVRARLDYFFIQPLDAEDPNLGTVSANIVAIGEAMLPIRLEATRPAANTIQLRWPADATGMQLWSRPSWAPGSGWSRVSQTPTRQGEFFVVTLAAEGQERYFILRSAN